MREGDEDEDEDEAKGKGGGEEVLGDLAGDFEEAIALAERVEEETGDTKGEDLELNVSSDASRLLNLVKRGEGGAIEVA